VTRRDAPPFEAVLVSYRSRSNIEQLLQGLSPDLPVAVVDNAEDDDLRQLVDGRPHGRYLRGGGVGFARAANLGARTSTHEFVVFVNPDTRPDQEVLDALVRDLAAEPVLASASANLVAPDGRVELGVAGWEPTPARAFVHATGLHLLRGSAGLFARPQPGEPLDVDWTSGACMAVRRATFVRLGGFDEDYYVYNEDVSFGRRVRTSGHLQGLRTDLLVPHGSGSSGAPSLEMMRLRGAAFALYVRRHNDGPATMTIMVCIIGGYSVRALHQLLVVKDRRRAAEHWAYVKGLVTRRAWVGDVEVARARSSSAPPLGTAQEHSLREAE
jgi:GT2 family glycosyltransferase